ncbi:unnamed protein product [Owenia fusiformis]|uniref:Condensin-2 complex subunit G2 n=1 Tax=Owenia fusiformis TaxID=6347 RepID=A0A8S4N4C8_OWEFU|nr:unnamed protein product [Owenia fusiformis]
MTPKRDLCLEACGSRNSDVFLEFIHTHISSKTDVVDIEEMVATLSVQQLNDMWQDLKHLTTNQLLEWADIELDEHMDQEKKAEVLNGVITLALASISPEAPNVPQPFFETVALLHGVLLTLPSQLDNVKTDIVKLCEVWWHRDLEGKEDLANSTIMCLLKQSLQHKAPQNDVKRVWGMRAALGQVDFTSTASEDLRDLLTQCIISLNYLKLDEGRRFLAYIFGMNPNFIEDLHKTIKNQLPGCSSCLLEWYGEVYFRAWRSATGPYLDKIEQNCIQDLMYHAIHLPRTSSKNLAASLGKVLHYIHGQKKQRGVDEMLLRLYDPIIWRSLKVANSTIRGNAVSLLIDAFPLQNPDSTVEELDFIMQKQFDALDTLLKDPCPSVRATVVYGVCHICNVYWELIPTQNIKTFIVQLIQDLAWDVGAQDVRIAVFKGITLLLDNHMSHPLLKPVLPKLQDFLHDSSEKVRIAVLDMLLKLKTLRTIKFWQVVPTDHLLARLEVDSAPVCRRIVQLTLNSYMPLDKPSDVQVTRTLTLVQSNPAAARCFYKYASASVPINQICKFIVLLYRCVIRCVQKTDNDTFDTGEDKENESFEANFDGMKNSEVVVGLLDTIAVLWNGIAIDLDKPVHKNMKKKLCNRLSGAIQELFEAVEDSKALSALLAISAHLPANTIDTLSESCLEQVRCIDNGDIENYGSVLVALCYWDKSQQLFHVFNGWIRAGLELLKNMGQQKSKGTQAANVLTQLGLGIDSLSYLTKHSVCRQLLLQNKSKLLLSTRELLKQSMVCLEKRFTNVQYGEMADTLLVNAFQAYCKISVILHDLDDNDRNMITIFEQILTWMDVEVVGLVKPMEQNEEQEERNPEQIDDSVKHIAGKLVEIVLGVACDMLLVGICDDEFSNQLTNFAIPLLETDDFLPHICMLLYQLTECTVLLTEAETDEGVGLHNDVIPDLFSKVIQALSKTVRKNANGKSNVFTSLRSSTYGALSSYYCNRVNPEDGGRDIMATVMAATIAEVTSQITKKQRVGAYENIQSLPSLSAFLIGMISRRKETTRLYVKELGECIKSGAIQETSGQLACTQILDVIAKAKKNIDGLKTCFEDLQVGLTEPAEEVDEGDEEKLLENKIRASTKNIIDVGLAY